MKTLSPDALIVAPRQELIDTIVSQTSQIKTQTKQNEQLKSRIQEIEFQLEWFKRQVFGSKSERFIPDDDLQTMLALGVEKQAESQPVNEEITYNRIKPNTSDAKQGHGRGIMPTHLPIVDEIIEPGCETTGMVRIGEEVSWYYEMKPGSLFVKRIIRPKYSLEKNDGVVIGELPALPVEKGNAGPGLMTQVVIDKYVYHMPLDRQRKKFKNEYSVEFSESWLCDIVKNTGFWIEPVHKAYIEKIITSSYLQADETPILVLTKDNKGRTHRGYFWVYYDPLNRIVIFDYRENRSGSGPSEFLKDFKGTLQIDGYEGYNSIITSQGLSRAACMDHVRRRFEKALEYDKERATYVLEKMKSWYEVERIAREQHYSLEQRFTDRREKTVPSMREFKNWLVKTLTEVLPKSPMGVAVTYALNQWPYFEPFMTDPRIEISNILIENAIRPVAIGRKNYLFNGSHDAARRAAMIYSLVSTAKLHDTDPFIYIKDLLTKLPSSKSNEIGQFLMPDWKAPQKDK
jgi:transposase